MSENIIKTRWYAFMFIGILGLLQVILSYCALIVSKKTGKHFSGVPVFGGIFLLIAGLVSPCQWLCLLCLLDYGFWEIPYILYCDYIKKDKHDD